MENIKIFPVNLYKFKNENHSTHKEQWMEYLSKPENFTNTRPNSTLNFTSPNLHVEPAFVDLVIWAKSCFEQVYEDLGFVPSLQITSAWCTKHVNQGSHAKHNHGNTFLAGVYYLHGTDQNSGTIWHHPYSILHNIIKPSRIEGKPIKDNRLWRHNFEEGTLLIFPSWLEHHTNANNITVTGTERFIMGFNTMPLGKTNQDEFDRFYYAEADPLDMISHYNEIPR